MSGNVPARPPRIPFTDWSPIPDRIDDDVDARKLSETQGRVLRRLYRAANRWTWQVKADDLETLALRIGWKKSPNSLYKVLSALRAKNRIAFETRPGNTRHPYLITLLYEGRVQGEQDAGESGETGPSRDAAQSGMDAGDAASERQDQSELEEAVSAGTSPSSDPTSPSWKEPAKPLLERDSETAREEPVRGAKDLSSKTLIEEKTYEDQGDLEDLAREGIPEEWVGLPDAEQARLETLRGLLGLGQ